VKASLVFLHLMIMEKC